MMEQPAARRVREILAAVRPLAAEYYQLTNKPLGVTGEIAENVAAELLGLEHAPPRTPGYDAVRHTPDCPRRIQIKVRAYCADSNPGQRLGIIKRGADCDADMLVLLDNRSLEPDEMWEAPYSVVEDRLNHPVSRSRERGALGVSEFKRLPGAERIWPR
jgi:hypothetical protein